MSNNSVSELKKGNVSVLSKKLNIQVFLKPKVEEKHTKILMNEKPKYKRGYLEGSFMSSKKHSKSYSIRSNNSEKSNFADQNESKHSINCSILSNQDQSYFTSKSKKIGGAIKISYSSKPC